MGSMSNEYNEYISPLYGSSVLDLNLCLLLGTVRTVPNTQSTFHTIKWAAIGLNFN